MEKITKENLIERIAVLRDENERFFLQDQIKRREFAQVFNWCVEKPAYGFSSATKESGMPSWERIFVEVGKLLAAKNFYNFKGNVSEIEVKIEDLEKKIIKKC